MALLNEQVAAQAREILGAMREPVEIELFTAPEDHVGRHLVELVGEVAALQPLLRVARRDLAADAARAAELGIARGPVAALRRAGDPRFPVRYFGLPAGHEFGAFLRVLLTLSTGRGADGVDAASTAAITAEATLRLFVLAA